MVRHDIMADFFVILGVAGSLSNNVEVGHAL